MKRLTCALLLCCLALPAGAAQVRVAVAANFLGTLKQLQPLYEKQSGNTLLLYSGSTGSLYAQILEGAPFDVFLAADRSRPQKLIDEGFGDGDNAFVYARGELVLWSPDSDLVDAQGQVLVNAPFRHLAIANPDTAPYGAAAMQALKALAVDAQLAPKLVRGNNIGQAWSFIKSGNAELGFVALSQLRQSGASGSQWRVPTDLYAPLDQMAVLLLTAPERDAALTFMRFLHSRQARALIAAAGYAPVEGEPAP